ncbi:MAG: hypothetical protein ACYSSO_12315 [Planctomycetota bacterium]|jgi:hypothetical protein
MSKGILIIIKTALMIAIVALAILSSLYVLDVFEEQLVKEALVKLMSVIGIFTGATLLLFVIALIGSQK